MEADGTLQKRTYKKQIYELTQMLDKTLAELNESHEAYSNIQNNNQKLKHSLQQKDVRIRFLQTEVSRLREDYSKLEKIVKQKQQDELMITQKSIKLSRLCNNQLENQLQYLKSENEGLVDINKQYSLQLTQLRKWKQHHLGQRSKLHEKVIDLKKDLQRKDQTISKLQHVIEKYEQQIQKQQIQSYLPLQKPSEINGNKTNKKVNTESDEQFHEKSNDSRSVDFSELIYLKDENLNIRSQLLILRQRNELIEQKYLQLQNELQSRIQISQKDSQTISDLIQKKQIVQSQNQQKQIEINCLKQNIEVKIVEIENKIRIIIDLEQEVNQLKSNIKIKTKQFQNQKLENQIEIEEIKNQQEQKQLQIKTHYQLLIEDKDVSYKAVKDELIKVKKYLENQVEMYSPTKITDLQAQNARLIDKVRILQEHILQDENTFHLSDRTPLVTISQTTLPDFEGLKRSYKDEIQQNQQSIIDSKYPKKIVQLQQKIQILQSTIKQNQQIINRQKQQIMQISNINRQLDQLQKDSKQQLNQYQNIKDQNVELHQVNIRLSLTIQSLQHQIEQLSQKRTQQSLKLIQQQQNDNKQNIIDSQLEASLSSTEHKQLQTQQLCLCTTHLKTIQKLSNEYKSLQQDYAVKDIQIMKLQQHLFDIQEANNIQINKLLQQKQDILRNHQLVQQQFNSTQSQFKIQLMKQKETVKYLQTRLKIIEQNEHNLNNSSNKNAIESESPLLQQQVQQSQFSFKINISEKNQFSTQTQFDNKQQQLQKQSKILKQQLILIEQKLGNIQQIKSTLEIESEEANKLITNSKEQIIRLQNQNQNLIIEITKFQNEIQNLKQQNDLQKQTIQKQHLQQKTELENNLKNVEQNLKNCQKQLIEYINKSNTFEKQNNQIISNKGIQQKLRQQKQELKGKIIQLQQQLLVSSSLLNEKQKHKYSIALPTDKTKQKKIIQKLKIQLQCLGKRQQLLLEDRKQLRQQIFLTKRQLEIVKEDLGFEKKRNNNLQELYDKFRKQKQSNWKRQQTMSK